MALYNQEELLKLFILWSSKSRQLCILVGGWATDCDSNLLEKVTFYKNLLAASVGNSCHCDDPRSNEIYGNQQCDPKYVA